MLMLFVALLAIAAGALAPGIAFRIKRDREEEMIHRGVQYSRAIRIFVKKTGRYPTRLEELENTNNIRFLRKRYKDPITGKDFKLLHVGEVQLTSAAGIAGAAALGSGVAGMAGAAALGGNAAGGAAALLGAAMGAAAAQASVGSPLNPASNRRRRLWGGRGQRQQQRPVQTGLEPAGRRHWQQPAIQRGFWRRPHRRRGQHQQSQKHPRVQSQEPLQPVAIHLRSHHGPGRPDHDAGAASVAGVLAGAAAELVESQLVRNAEFHTEHLRRDAERAAGATRAAATAVGSANIWGRRMTGEDARPPLV